MNLCQAVLEDRKNDIDCGWDEKRALEEWAKLAGPSPMDAYVLKFLTDEVQLCYRRNPDQVTKWQQMLCRLIEVILQIGMPMERLGLSTFHKMNQQARNAEEALLAMLSACACSTQRLSQINWGSPEGFGNWLYRLQGYRKESESLTLSCLMFLNLEGCILDRHDLCGASLEGARLFRTSLAGAHLVGARLMGASLVGARLMGASLYRASLGGASLDGAHLDGAILDRASLKEASLKGASLLRASLEETSLLRVSLDGASLKWARLQRVNLEGASLQRASLEGANLDGANLEGADLARISFEKSTRWDKARGLASARNLPYKLKQQLGLEIEGQDPC